MKVLKQNKTHKAILNGDKIDIYLKGMDINYKGVDGTKVFDEEDLKNIQDGSEIPLNTAS